MRLTVRDVAELLNVSEKTIYRWIGKGEIPVYRLKEQCRFSRAEIMQELLRIEAAFATRETAGGGGT